MKHSILTLLVLLIGNTYSWSIDVDALKSQWLSFSFKFGFNAGMDTGYWGLERRPPGFPPIAF